MASYLGTKPITGTPMVVDRGLNNVNITDADVRTGKVSIGKNGEKIIGKATERYVENNTPATANPEHINSGKTGWKNGVQLTGTYTAKTLDTVLNGTNSSYTVTGATVNAGDFVKFVTANSTVTKITSYSDTIIGIALATVAVGGTVQVKRP